MRRFDRAAPSAAPAAAAPAAPAPQVIHIAPSRFAQADPVNVSVLQAVRLRQPRDCGPSEVAPGAWVRIDCHAYTQVQRVMQHWTPRKARVVGSATAMRRFVPGGGGGGERAGAAPGGGGGSQRPGERDNVVLDVVDHRTGNLEGPIKNQGYVGACTAFSLSSTMDNALRRAGKQETMSPTHLWAHYAEPRMNLAGDANVNKGITTFENWPYSAKEACKMLKESGDDCGDAYGVQSNSASRDAKIQANLTAADSNGQRKITAIEKLETGPVNIDEVVSVLNSGADLWIAMKIDGSKWSTRAMRNNVIPDWSDWSGGHAVVMAGYRKTASGKEFLIHNSWGESWGDRGYAWVSEAMVQKFMHYAYKVKLDEGSVPPPAPTAVQWDDECTADELVDSTTGRCATICPDNTRPNNGCGGAVNSGAPKKK